MSNPKSIQFTVANSEDDAEIRALLREAPMSGLMKITFEREPSCFLSSTIEGNTHELIVCRQAKDHKLIGMGGRFTREYYVNGKPVRLGYLSQLRTNPAMRGYKKAFGMAYKALKQFHDKDPVPFYLSTIFESNMPAIRLLTSKKMELPTYTPTAKVFSFTLRPKNFSFVNTSFTFGTIQASELKDFVSKLNQYNRQFQFAPVWKVEDFLSEKTRGLNIDDIYVVKKDGKIIAGVALWDQMTYKQIQIHSYHGWLKWLRPLMNTIAPIVAAPYLPKAPAQLKQAFLSHLFINDNREDVFLFLMKNTLGLPKLQIYSYLNLGFCEGHPLLNTMRKQFRSIVYNSILYLVYWEKSEILEQLDSRPAHVEVSIL